MPEAKENAKPQSCIKMALAIGLTVVFLLVVTVQVRTYSSDATTELPPTSEAAKRTQRASAGSESEDRTPSAAEPSRRIVWPEVELGDCTAHDPFATPEGFLPKRAETQEQGTSQEAQKRELALAQKRAAQRRAISELTEAGVNAVFVGPNGTTALVGTQQLVVGQEIHGHRVIAIQPDGVVLEPIDPELSESLP